MPSSRGSHHLLAVVVCLVLASIPLAGCAGKSAAAGQTSSLTVSKSATGGAASGTQGSVKIGAFSSAGSIQYPVIAENSLLEPPSYAGFEPLPSFTYHHVDPKITNDITITPATFEAELKTLQSLGYHSVTAREVVEHQIKGTPLPDKPVMLSFDDGWITQYTNAWPLLQKYGFKATFFINPQPISAGYRAYLTRDMVETLAKAGNDIESHTWRHYPLTRSRTVSAAAFQKGNVSELTRASAWIATAAGQAPVAICYPYGYYDLEAIGLARAVGYSAGFSVDEGVSDARPWDAFQMKRFTITSAETADSFRRRLLSGPLPVTDIQPAPGSRSVGTDTKVSVNIADVPSSIGGVHLSGGPAMKKMQIVTRDGKKYVEAVIHGGRVGFHAISVTGTDASGRAYYASWGIETGDK